MKRIACWLVFLMVVVHGRAQEVGPDPKSAADDKSFFDHQSLAEDLRYIRPSEAELGWMNIPWRATLGEAVRDAKRAGKPILLWAMNGHPLACV